jgi:hypothetical protein
MIKLADNRVEIPLDFSDEELLVLFKQAHEADLTFNKFIEQALIEFLEKHTNDNLLNKLDGPSQSKLVQNSWPYPNGNKDSY